MEGLSNYQANLAYQSIFGKVAYTAPTTLYLALAKGTVLESDTGSTFDEANYTNYTRIAVANNTTTFPAPTEGVGIIGIDVTFPTSGGVSNDIVEFIILDASTGGNIVGGGVLTIPQTVDPGEQPFYAAGQIEITVV